RSLRTILFLEPIARILVAAAGTPVVAAPLGGRRPVAAIARLGRRAPLLLEVRLLCFAGVPQFAAREPAHRHVCALALKLDQGRLQFLALAGAEGRRLPVDQNRPVGVTRRHPAILPPSTSRSGGTVTIDLSSRKDGLRTSLLKQAL